MPYHPTKKEYWHDNGSDGKLLGVQGERKCRKGWKLQCQLENIEGKEREWITSEKMKEKLLLMLYKEMSMELNRFKI